MEMGMILNEKVSENDYFFQKLEFVSHLRVYNHSDLTLNLPTMDVTQWVIMTKQLVVKLYPEMVMLTRDH